MSSKTRTIHSGKIMTVVAFGAFLATFNETYLNVSFPRVMADFGVGVSVVQWLATAYLLGAAVMVPVSAFLYRSIRTRRLFLLATGLLIAGSVVGAFAWAFPVLLLGRIIQALGTGLLIPVGMNIMLDVAPREKIGSYMGLMGAMTTLGPSLSVIVAGILLSLASWQLLLWVFAGLALLCFLSGAFLLEDIAELTRPRLDKLSVVLISLALVCILYGISIIFTWNVPVIAAAFVVGFICLYLFVRRQNRLEQPLIDMRPLKVTPFAIGVVINMLTLIVIFAMNIIIPIYMQTAMHASAMDASLTLFPAIILSCIVAPLAGRVYDRYGAKILLPLGFLLIAIFSFLLGIFQQTGSAVVLALLYIPVICGSALIIGPVQGFALSFLAFRLNPYGVTVLTTGFQIAGCIGSSLFTGVYAAVVGADIASGGDVVSGAMSGFTATGVLAAVVSLIGVALAICMCRFKRDILPVPAISSFTLDAMMKRDVYSVALDASLMEAMTLITEKKISGVPVLDADGQPVGFVSDGDILRFLAKTQPLFDNVYFLPVLNSEANSFDSKLMDLLHIRVADFAQRKVVTVDAEDDLAVVSRILSQNHIKKAPVMKEGRMVGIINRSNITKYAINTLRNGATR